MVTDSYVRNKIAFLTCIFPLKNNFSDDYFESLNNQKFKEFDLILLNDGFSGLNEYKNKFCDLNIIEISAAGGIPKNREKIINYAISNEYEYIVFGDFDDFFDENRVGYSLSRLDDVDIVVNEIKPFWSVSEIKKGVIGEEFKDNEDLNMDSIRNKNIFGLSNTAIRVNAIKDEKLSLSNDLIAVDWFVFSKFILSGCSAVFTNKTNTYYRQYESNEVGVMGDSFQNFTQSVKVRCIHYREMIKLDPTFEYELNESILLSDEIKNGKGATAFNKINEGRNKMLMWWEI